VVAGQSFGGLAAMFAALNWPQRFGCVLSQSGSYWWPHRDGRGTGFIGEQLRQGEVSAAGLRIWLEAGREPIIFRANQALLAQLTQQTIFWRQVDGGHDALCWRGGLTAGLIQLWQPLLSHLSIAFYDRSLICNSVTPSTIRKGSFTFCAMISSSTACGRRTATCRKAGRWSARRSR
jgi:pimeloyl-ACP methyl ester carboxylesterase